MDAFDVSTLTLGEVAKVEEISGVAVGLIEDATVPKGKLFAALVYVVQKRSDPKYTLAMAMDLSLDDATNLLGGSSPDDAVAGLAAAPFDQPASSHAS